MRPLNEIYHGSNDPRRPYALVVRHGTRGETRERVESMLRGIENFKTRHEAECARCALADNLRPFVAVERLTAP